MTGPEGAKVVNRLVDAWDSGNRHLLSRALRQAQMDLDALSLESSLDGELQDLLLSVVENLADLLGTGEEADPWGQPRAAVCYALLQHARGLIADSLAPGS